jgi:NAD(P)-dependent dehydrogenase (short-subunit alcohol dehydrogenase family)
MQDVLGTFNADLFAGKSAIVSGGTSGIGLEIARGFSGLGAEVIVLGSNAAKLAALEQSDNRLKRARLDVRDTVAVRTFCAGQIRADILINAAGIARPDDEWAEDGFVDVVDVNLNGQMRLAYGLMDQLRASRGAIVNIASMLSFLADANVPAYASSKSGLLGLTRSLAHKLGPDGVRVNAIAPGYHTTEMTEELRNLPGGEAAVRRRAALRRWGTAHDLVGAALFLCSPAAAYITGVCLPVDGGYVTGNPLIENEATS